MLTLLVGSSAAAPFSSPALAHTWDVEFTPSPAITTSIDSGAVPMRTRIDVIRLTAPVLREDLAGAGEYWESRVEVEGVGFDDFVDAHFSYRTQGLVRVPASHPGRGPGQDIHAVAVFFHGGYWSPAFAKEIDYFPDTATEADDLVGVPALGADSRTPPSIWPDGTIRGSSRRACSRVPVSLAPRTLRSSSIPRQDGSGV